MAERGVILCLNWVFVSADVNLLPKFYYIMRLPAGQLLFSLFATFIFAHTGCFSIALSFRGAEGNEKS